MKASFLIRLALATLLVTALTAPAIWAKEPLPDFLETANTAVTTAATAGGSYPELADDILIAKNSIRNANIEYDKNLGAFSGKLDTKAEPLVRQLAETARLQASLVIAKAGAKNQDKERVRLEGLIRATKAKIKIFDDLVLQAKDLKKQSADQAAKIASLEAKVSSLNAELAAKGTAMTSSGQKTASLLKALDEQKKATASSEQRVAALTGELEALKQQTAQLQASGEQLAAEKRIKEFEAEVGKLGGIVKATATGLGVTFPRSQLLKTTSKSTTLTPGGTTILSKVAALLKAYPEYRIKLRVHGFGQPTRNEDIAATDQMARFSREALLTAGRLEPATVEALGVGTAEPMYSKANVEGNRRVEFIFVK
jgi:outer membrane protein OmpA-like peptidoglycan-associated protein